MKEIIKKIKKKGFTHIKVECEINIGRENSKKITRKSCTKCYHGKQTCPVCKNAPYKCESCNGERIKECTKCKSKGCSQCWDNGMLTCKKCDSTGHAKCEMCNGTGNIECLDCHGDWEEKQENKEAWNPNTCKEAIHNKLITENIHPEFTYSKVYRDGTVDTEWTFTIPIDNAEMLPSILKVFKEALEPCTGFWEDHNAGLHIALMTSGNMNDSSLDPARVETLKEYAKRLLFGMYACGTAKSYTRPWQYRKPQINERDKYSAINCKNNQLLEFRFFDPCYEAPNRILDYIRIMSAIVQFYALKAPVTIEKIKGKEMMMEGPNNRYCPGGTNNHNEERTFDKLFVNEESVARVAKEIEFLLGRDRVEDEFKRMGLKLK